MIGDVAPELLGDGADGVVEIEGDDDVHPLGDGFLGHLDDDGDLEQLDPLPGAQHGDQGLGRRGGVVEGFLLFEFGHELRDLLVEGIDLALVPEVEGVGQESHLGKELGEVGAGDLYPALGVDLAADVGEDFGRPLLGSGELEIPPRIEGAPVLLGPHPEVDISVESEVKADRLHLGRVRCCGGGDEDGEKFGVFGEAEDAGVLGGVCLRTVDLVKNYHLDLGTPNEGAAIDGLAP
jgi:hypothetical protein